jgi:hypothetical protein
MGIGMSNETIKQWREKVRWPWNKQPVFRPPSNKGQLIAIVISTLALIVSTVATVATWRQVDVMQLQLTAADRNAINIKLAVALYDACHEVMLGPVAAVRFAYSSDGYLLPLIEGEPREITKKERDAYGWSLEQKKREIALLLMQASIFATDESLVPILRIQEVVQSRLDAAQDVASDYSAPHLDLKKIIEIGVDCQMATRKIIETSSNPPSFNQEINKILSHEQPLGLHN